MLHGALTGSLGLASPSGWMNAELFVKVIVHFIKHTCASSENPALLVMDKHESHVSIVALNLDKRPGVTVLTLHPHTTAKVQPLDVGPNGYFKVYYNSAVDSWLMRNPGQQMSIYNVAECIEQAHLKAMTPTNIMASENATFFPMILMCLRKLIFCHRLSQIEPEKSVRLLMQPTLKVQFQWILRQIESPLLLNDSCAGMISHLIAEPNSHCNHEISTNRATMPDVKNLIPVPSGVKPFKSPKKFMPPIKASQELKKVGEGS